MKPIRLSEHAFHYMKKRGFSLEEVRETIQTVEWSPSEQGGKRMQCSKEFEFKGMWNKRNYTTKRVRPVFVEEEFLVTLLAS